MKPSRKIIYLIGFLLLICGAAIAQKNIIISDSLSANADMLKIKLGIMGFGKIPKFSFGDYKVVSSKAGWTKSSSNSNLFNTKTESTSSQKFSFVLTDKENDSAKLNAANNISQQTLNEVEILPHFLWGENELLKQTVNFSASININGDTSNTWVLLMNNTTGSRVAGKYEAFLTNGERKILIFPSSSSKEISTSAFANPALGYEFFENEKPISAIQYYGGGMFPDNRNIIWLKKDVDSKTKLIVAAAMTAILNLKLSLR